MSPLEEQIKDMASGLHVDLNREKIRLIADCVAKSKEYEASIRMIEELIFAFRETEGN